MCLKDFYNGANILISGGTGFIGKVLIEKLLRSFPNIRNIFVIVRSKKGKSLEDRIEHLISGPLFDLLRSTNPSALNKIIPIKGDVSEINLGLSNKDRELLIENTNVIFHAAASVKFNDGLKDATFNNIRSTRDMALLALEMKALKVFLHVSTAYCNVGKEKVVLEKLYPQKGDWKDAITVAENSNEFILNTMLQKYIEGFPNTYTYTKHLAEHCIKDILESKIPTVIFRPTIVVSCLEEPMIGWTDNLNGPTGILVAAGLGILRNLFANRNNRLDYIPVDIVVKLMILAACNMALKRTNQTFCVMQMSANSFMDITIEEMANLCYKISDEIPFEKTIWFPNLNITLCWFYYYINFFLFQLIPAIFIDLGLKAACHEPFLVKIQRKIWIINLMLYYFCCNNWVFVNEKCLENFKYISKEEREDFSFRFPENDHEVYEYLKICGDRVRWLKLGEDKVIKQRTRRIHNVFYWLDKIVKIIFCCSCIWILFFKLNITSFLCNYLTNYWNTL